MEGPLVNGNDLKSALTARNAKDSDALIKALADVKSKVSWLYSEQRTAILDDCIKPLSEALSSRIAQIARAAAPHCAATGRCS
jgi:hypothetical protein